MATEVEKQDLYDTLAFVPKTYRIEIWGYGGEHVMGHVSRDIYQYFQDNDISIEEFATNGEYGDQFPIEMWPFTAGEWYECDSVCHESSAYLDQNCSVVVLDENNEEVWRSELDYSVLTDLGIEVEAEAEYYANDFDAGTCVYIGRSIEKGMFFEGDIELTSPFQPKKLKFITIDFEDVSLVTQVFYHEKCVELINMDTVGKGMEHQLVCVGEEL